MSDPTPPRGRSAVAFDQTLDSAAEHPQAAGLLETLDSAAPHAPTSMPRARSVFASLPIVEDGRFAARGILGSGGMGRVERAFDQHLEREIAVKTLHGIPEDPGQHATLESRFLDEARITSQLEHPGVVPVYEIGRQPDGAPFYAMKQVRGQTLTAALTGRDFAGRMRLLPRLVDVCQAVAYAHSRGVLHRDLKPDNVMLGDFGETLVVDWGLAKAGEPTPDLADVPDPRGAIMSSSLDGRTRAGQLMGTPAYMSPEQARGEATTLDARTDVWALGVMLFQLVTGEVPFQADRIEELMYCIQRGMRPSVYSLEKACPPELEAIIDKALSLDRDARYADAADMVQDLERYLSDELVGAHRYTALQRLRRFVYRHRLAIGMTITLMLVAGGAWLWRDRQFAAAERAARAVLVERIEAVIDGARTHRPAGWRSQVAARLASLSSRLSKFGPADGDPRDALAPLVVLLEDPEPAMRRLAAQALGLTGESAALDPLLARLEPDVEPDQGVVIDVINALGVLGDARAEKPVQTARLRYGHSSYVGVNTHTAALMLPVTPPGPEEDSDAWADHGASLMLRGRKTKGLAAYARALELEPGNPRALINRGLTLRKMGRLTEAIADYDRVLSLDDVHPLNRATTRLNRAVAHRSRGAWAASSADLDQLIASGVDRHQTSARRSRAQTRWLSGDAAGARRDIDRALAAQPDNRRTIVSDARLWLSTGDLDRALDRANRAVDIEGQSAFALRFRAWLHRNRGDRPAARLDLEQCMSLEPTSPACRTERLAVLVADGDLATARADEGRLFEEHPTDGAQWAAVAVRIYAATGAWDTAAERLELAADKATPAQATTFALLHHAVAARLGREAGPLPAPTGEVIWPDRVLGIAAGTGDPAAAAREVRNPPERCLLRVAVYIRDARTGQSTALPPATGYAAGVPDLPDLACELLDALGLER